MNPEGKVEVTHWWSGIAEWWADVSAPQATLIAAAGFAVIGSVTVWQRLRADRRDQWWKRTQWAVDLAMSDDEYSQIIGWAAIARISKARLATREDRLLLRQVVDVALDLEADDSGEDDNDNDTNIVVLEASDSDAPGEQDEPPARY